MSDDGADARRVAPPEPLAELLSMWRQMIAKALAKGPIEYDEIGHASRWTAVEMCADELERAIRAALDTQPPQAPQKEFGACNYCGWISKTAICAYCGRERESGIRIHP
jgi:hypothetical protein